MGRRGWTRGWRGVDQLSGVLFVVFCRVYEPLSPPPSRLLSLRDAAACLPSSALRFALFVTPFPLLRMISPCVLSSLTSFPSPPCLSGFRQAAGNRRRWRAKCVRGASFRKQRQRRRSSGRRTLLPVMAGGHQKHEGGAAGCRGFYRQTLANIPVMSSVIP